MEVIAAATVILAIRRQWRLATYLLVTGAGALILDPVLKSLVGRLRPVVAHPIAHGTGDSFPSGHHLARSSATERYSSSSCRRPRPVAPVFITVIAALVALIGISRILLGVHYLSDVVGAWALGITWLGITAFAFELTRSAAGQPVTDPVAEGLEPEARTDLKPAQPDPPWSWIRPPPRSRRRRSPGGLGADPGHHRRHRRAGHQGRPRQRARRPDDPALVRRPPYARPDPLERDLQHARGDPGDPHRRARHLRGVPRCHPALAAGRLRRRGHVGELGAFLAAAAVVRRPRPGVTQLDQHLPTSAYPSGHEAATCCLYSPSRSWSSAMLAAGGDGCSSSPRSPCPFSWLCPACTGASVTRPISSPASFCRALADRDVSADQAERGRPGPAAYSRGRRGTRPPDVGVSPRSPPTGRPARRAHGKAPRLWPAGSSRVPPARVRAHRAAVRVKGAVEQHPLDRR